MICPNCNQEAKITKTTIHNGKLVTTCENCSKLKQPHQLAAKNRREQQKKDFRRDLTQPTEKRAFTQAYPDKAREMYGDEEFRSLS